MTPSDKANRQFWVSRRQDAPKPPGKLSVTDFVTEANRQLCADKAYVAGTRFIVIPAPAAAVENFRAGKARRPCDR